MAELKQTNIPSEGTTYLTEAQIRALIVEATTNFTDVMRVKKQILLGDKFILDGSDGTQRIKDSSGNTVILFDANG